MLIEELLEEFEVGLYQRWQTLFMGAVFLVDGGAVLLSSAILGALQEEWAFTNTVKGLMISIMFIGIFVGSLAGGVLADSYGRKRVVVASYAGILVWSVLSAMAAGPVGMTVLRFLLGISFGAGIPACVALVVESVNQAGGKHLINKCAFWFLGGEVYVATLLVIMMPKLTNVSPMAWRWVTLLSVAPTLVALPFMCYVLQESPHFLYSAGRREEAIKVLTYIAETNGKRELIDRFDELDGPEASEGGPLLPGDRGGGGREGGRRGKAAAAAHWSRSLCGPDVATNVVAGSYLCFLGNLFFYGASYVLPQVFSALAMDIAPATELMLVSLASFPGLGLVEVLLLADRLSDRDRLLILTVLSCIFEIGITQVRGASPSSMHAMLLVACLLKSMVYGFFNMVYIFLGRAFPAEHRCMAMSFCFSVGRLGSIFAPLLCEFSEERTQGPNVYFFFCAVAAAVAILAIRFSLQEFHFVAVDEAQDEVKALPAPRRGSAASAGSAFGRPAARRSFVRRHSASFFMSEAPRLAARPSAAASPA